ncbi:MAG: RHS repeat-associated core domain-containing protein [Clostridia bacterium]
MENKNYFAGEMTNAIEQDIVLAPDSVEKESEPEIKDSAISLNTEDIASEDVISKEMEASFEVEETPVKAVRVNEIPELRGENSKVFRMSDGTEQAVFYVEPIHVLNDETQCFEAADTELTEKDNAFVSGKTRFTAEFSKDESNDELFHITDGSHRVTVLVAKIGRQKQDTVAALKKVTADETAAAVDQIADKVTFAKVEADADITYSLTASGVKEDIVVREKADVYRYSFLLRMENVAPEFDEEERRIAFMDLENGEEVFHIPAPFMTDADGNLSSCVSYDVKELDSGEMLLTVTADSEWLNAEERVFPVVIDPQIKVSGTSAMTTYSWVGGRMSSASTHTIGTNGSGDGNCNANRMYMKLTMPTLSLNPRIKKAELKFYQSSGSTQCGGCPKLGLYQVTDSIVTGTCTPVASSDLIDYDTMKTGHCEDGEVISYTFDITKLLDAVNKGETSYANLVLKMLDETSSCNDKIVLYGSSYGGTYAPQLVVTYESSYGVNTSYRTHTHELGRFGQGSIDLACGNLMFESEDFAWASNKMPVILKHLYNSALASYQYTANSTIKLNTANFSAMKLGCGFRLNVMQSMVSASFQHEGTAYTGYVYIGENGEETYFKKSSKTCTCSSNTQCYNLYEDVNGGDMLYDPEKRTLTSGEDIYAFDTSGRLLKVTSGKNSIVITYTSGRISSVTDGAGRIFGFAYNASGFLTSVTAPDGTNILYTYSGNLLSTVTYPNGKKVTISYSSNKPTQIVLLEDGTNVYKVSYTYSGNRVASVTEYGYENGTAVKGASTAYSYSAASRRTIATTTEQKEDGESANNVIKTVYTFDDDGNIVSEYVYSQDIGNIGADGEESGINPHSGDGGAGVVSNINNLLVNHSFETLDNWTSMPCNCGSFFISNYNNDSYAKFGGKTCWMRNHGQERGINGIYQVTNVLPAGNYTFSAYARIDGAFSGCEDSGVFIRVTDTSDNILVESERLVSYDTEYIRLIAPFVLTSAKSVKVQILINGNGSVDIDAAQLENNAFANAYNMLENGNFERGTNSWSKTAGVSYSTSTRFNMSKSLYMSGNLTSSRYAYQKVTVKTSRSTRETFTLSGWAKGYGIVNRERDFAQAPQFRLRAVVKYYDTAYREYGTETYTADFSPCTEEWQLASVQFAKEKFRTIRDITVYCDYSYNVGSVYFDDIQLVRNSIETNLSASDFTVESTGGTDSDETVEDGKNTASDTTPDFQEATDAFGNALTETTFTDGEFGTIYRSFGFNADNGQLAGNDAGNNLIRETDARGNDTEYAVDSVTSRNEEVIDRCGNKTAYEYDAYGRTTKVTSFKARRDENNNPIRDNNCEIVYDAMADVSYTYDSFDNMTEIARGDGMKYALAYNAFHNLESIGVDGKDDKLVKYDYKNGNGRLKSITYANGHVMKATYNSIGQMVAEKWFANASATTAIAHYKYVYDGQGNIVRSIDILQKKEYTYSYEDGRIIRATESAIKLDANESVIGKTLLNSILYTYDYEGKLTKKRIIPANGSERVIYYENMDDNTVVKFTAGGKTVTSHSKTDSFGRKVFDELQLGTGFVSRQFHYHEGAVTQEHTDAGKLKSTATTQLVSQIVLSGGRTISYEYDAEERITKVTDSMDGTTLYTYDALGQLLTETHNGEPVNTMVYDNYGNIVSKNGKAYTYDSTWKDLLTSYDGQSITYDAQGNPTSYLGHTLEWEKGRQLKNFDNNTYTYNANGIRTSKTVNDVKHEYVLDGSKILKEVWNENTLIPMYDNEESVCGIIFKNIPYYFQKNLQGDIIAIADKNAKVVAKYSYDAWGVCTVISDISETNIAAVNPYRYRGYYYDSEIGMYYLQSRYFNPIVGRFVNVDETCFIPSDFSLSTNLWTYCLNNATNYTDSKGFFGTPIQWACAIIGGVAGWFFGDYVARGIGLFPGKWWQWQTAAYWAVRGLVVVGGAVLGYVAGTVLLKLATKYLLMNSWVASRMPKILLWFLGMGGAAGQVANDMFSRYAGHIFSNDHIRNGIMRLGTSQRDIFNKIFNIISSKIGQAQNGSNQIYATIKGIKVTIRFYFQDGQFRSINAFIGWAKDVIGKLLK